jgi:hypothetical protein
MNARLGYPRYLYKYYSNLQYARDLIERGTLRITTLAECRKVEGDVARGDAVDGYLNADFHIENGRDFIRDHPEAVEFLRYRGFDITDQTTRLTIGASAFGITEAFMFCASTINSRIIGDAFNAIACVEIRRIPMFFRKLTQALGVSGYIANGEHLIGEVFYYNPPLDWRKYGFHHPGFCKREDDFAYQKEVRMLWQPRELEVPREPKPFNINVPQIRSLCRFVEINPGNPRDYSRMPPEVPSDVTFGVDGIWRPMP